MRCRVNIRYQIGNIEEADIYGKDYLYKFINKYQLINKNGVEWLNEKSYILQNENKKRQYVLDNYSDFEEILKYKCIDKQMLCEYVFAENKNLNASIMYTENILIKDILII